MDAREFLLAVVPWDEGYTTIHGQRPGAKGFSGRSCRTIDEAMDAVAKLMANTRNHIYFCLSRQRLNSGQRSRQHALGLNCVWLEGDVRPGDPKAFQTIPDAIASVLYFCQLMQIPNPSIIVTSGRGIHVYWISNRTLTVEEWQPYANALINAVKSSTLKVKDIGVTGDAARVLRVPGTTNWKYDPPPEVCILQSYSDGRKHDFSVIFADMLKLAPVAPAKPNGKLWNLGPLPAAFAHLPLVDMGKGVKGYPPLVLAPIKAACPWVREAHDTGGKLFDEPQWNLTTLIATWMENGHELAHQFGNQHPDYDPATTEEKWSRKIWDRGAQNIGWPLCRTIQNSGSRHCSTCPHLALGKSPLHFGLPAPAPPKDEEIEELGGEISSELPQGFCHNEKGRICAIVPGKVGKNEIVAPTRIVQLTSSIMKDPSLQHQEGQFGLSFTASTDMGGWHEVFVPSSHSRSEKLLNHLAAAFVRCADGGSNKEVNDLMAKFMNSWMDKLQAEQKALRDAGTLGWRYEDSKKMGFVYGGFLYHIDGSESPIKHNTDDEFRRWYMPVGRKEPWLAASKLLTNRKRPELDVILCIAFASPLLAFTGTVYGIVVSTWGEPGTAKSTAQQIAAAVWGHPKQTRESLNSTPKSIQSRLGRTKNLPAYWDDIQDEKHQEGLAQTMFVASQGSEGGRLNPDTSYKERKDWQTLLGVCSNASLVEFLAKKQKSTTAGMRRVFEFPFNKIPNEQGMVDSLDASLAFGELEHNYGVVGAEYAKLLATEHDQVAKLLYENTQLFKEAVTGTPDENFWWQLGGVLITGGMLANRLGTEIDVPRMAGFLARAFLNNRRTRSNEGTEGGSWGNTEQSLAAFLNYHTGIGHVLHTDRMFIHRSHPIKPLRNPEAGKPVYVQVARDERKVIISKRRLREWLQQNNIQSKPVFDGMAEFLKAKEVKLTLGGGTGLGMTQELCMEIPVPAGGHLLEGILTVTGQPKS